jgi:hypothetical protein
MTPQQMKRLSIAYTDELYSRGYARIVDTNEISTKQRAAFENAIMNSSGPIEFEGKRYFISEFAWDKNGSYGEFTLEPALYQNELVPWAIPAGKP